MNDWIIVNVIVAFAALLQAITGFGFAIMATPFLLLVMDSRDSIQISIFLSFFIACVMTPKVRQEIDWTLLRRLAGGSLLGAPAGLWLFITLSVELVKLVVAIAVMAVALFAVYSYFWSKVDSEQGFASRHARWLEPLAGFVSGILTVSIGMPGVPLAVYFAQGHIAKEQVRSTTLGFFVMIYIASMSLQALAGQVDGATLLSSLALVPATLLGVFAGTRLFGRLNQEGFRLLVNGILLYTGLHMLWKIGF